MLAPHGASVPPVLSARGSRRVARFDDCRGRRPGRTRRMGRRLDRPGRARRRRRRRSGRHLRRLPTLPGVLHVSSGLLRTPRPVPSRTAPLAAGAAVLVLALPVYAVAGWRLSGWALATVLW